MDCDHCLGVDGSKARGSERLSGCVLKRLTPIIAPKRERDGDGERGVRGVEGRPIECKWRWDAIFGTLALNKTQLPN